MKLNLGCAGRKQDGYTNVDWNPVVTPDISHDLNQFPYPFDDNSVDEIRAFHIIEHLDSPFKVMKEFHRILKPGGLLHIKVPHCSRGFTHSEHCHGFDVSFPFYFNPIFYEGGYLGFDFNLDYMYLRWLGNVHLLKYTGIGGGKIATLKVIDKILSTVANFNVYFCSRIWCFWVGGFDEIEFKFKKK